MDLHGFGIQMHGCAIIWIVCSFIIISAMHHMGELGVAYGGGGQLVFQNVDICSTSLGWPRMHPGMSGRVPGGSKQILYLINAIVLNVCSCCVLFCAMNLAIGLPIAYCILPRCGLLCLFAPGVELLLVSTKNYMFMSTLMLKPPKVATYIYFEWLEHECGHGHATFDGDQ